MSEVPFFTPPILKPLGIDAVALKGGGYGPSQHFGRMADGRGIYCRYRGGRLTVQISKNPGEEAGYGDEFLLDSVIGPHLHGGLSIGQLCRYAGVTVNGITPPFPTAAEIAEWGLLDLSGQTTFLDLKVESSRDSAISFYDAIVSDDQGIMGCDRLDANWSEFRLCQQGASATGWRMCLVRRIDPNPTARFWPDQVVSIRDVGSVPVFGVVQHCAFSDEFKPHPLTYIGRPNKKVVFLREKGAFPADNLWLRLSFPTEDERGRELATAVHRIFVRTFPPTAYLAYDIETGERVPDKDLSNLAPLDPEIAKWIAAEENRWLSGFKIGDSCIGYRPGK